MRISQIRILWLKHTGDSSKLVSLKSVENTIKWSETSSPFPTATRISHYNRLTPCQCVVWQKQQQSILAVSCWTVSSISGNNRFRHNLLLCEYRGAKCCLPPSPAQLLGNRIISTVKIYLLHSYSPRGDTLVFPIQLFILSKKGFHLCKMYLLRVVTLLIMNIFCKLCTYSTTSLNSLG
jgi:hypothetical protein